MNSIVTIAASGLTPLASSSSNILAAPAASPDGGYLITSSNLSGGIENFTLGFDLYVPSGTEGTWNGLFQTDLTNQSDGDLFMHTVDGGGFGIGISGQYQGSIPHDAWARVVFTVEANGDGSSTLLKYIDGINVGTQVVDTARFTIDGDNGFLILADENNETLPTHLSAFAFLPMTLDESEVIARGATSPAGFGVPEGIPGGFEFTFADGDLGVTTGNATMAPRSEAEAGTLTTSDALGIPSSNQYVLAFDAADPDGGFGVDPALDADATSFSLVYDILVPAENQSYGGLFQVGTDNTDDAELFLKSDDDGNFGVGISGQYEGEIAPDTWARLVVTVEDNGDGSSLLAKYIDGALVGTQTVDTARFTVNAETGFSILADNDNETYSGFLANFAFGARALSADEVAGLGGPTADAIDGGVFGEADRAVFDFAKVDENGVVEAVAGDGTLVDLDVDAASNVRVEAEINAHLITVGETVTIDLAGVFSGEDLTYEVTGDDGSAIAFSLDGDTLTVEGVELGFRDFTVTATDAEGDSASDNFRVRAAGENAYTFAVLPDTQDYSWRSEDSPMFRMTDWLAAQKESLGLTAVLHVGDVTGSNAVYEWGNISDAYEALEEAGIPYTLLPGNHDQTSNAADHGSNQDVYFGMDRYFAQSEGGVYDGEPDSTRNNYKTFTAPDGTDWLVLSLEFGPRDDVIRWANEVLSENADHRAIVMTHHYTNMGTIAGPRSGAMYGEGTGKNYGMQSSDEAVNDGSDLWDNLVSKHANVSFVFSGHVFGDGAETIIQTGEGGNSVAQMLVNYQNGVATEAQTAGDESLLGNGGNGAIRLVTIDPENGEVHTETYYTDLDRYMTGSRGDPEPSRDGSGLTGGDTDVEVQELGFGTTGDLGFPDIEGGSDSAMVATPQFNSQNGLWVDPGYAPENGGDTYLAYTLVFDMYLPEDIGLWSILQTDTSNLSDGDLWLQDNADGKGLIGLSGQDDGPFELGGWRRIVVTYEATDEFGSSYKLNKYVDGELIGSQILSGASKIITTDGFILFGDDGNETPAGSGLSAFAMLGTVLDGDAVAALGGVTADGPFAALPEGVEGTQWNFADGDLTATFGSGTMSQQPINVSDEDVGLTGRYLEHQETIDSLGISAPEVQFHAIAGEDQDLAVDGDTTVVLDGSQSVDKLAQVTSALWTNADGEVVGEGLTAEIAALGGANRYTLTLTDADGHVSTDSVLVVGRDADQLLFDGFNDGDLDGWTVLSGSFQAAGAVNSGAGTPEGHLQAGATASAGLVLYTGADTAAWDDYTVSAEIENESDQAMGLVAGANGEGDGYRLAFDVGNNRVSLLKVVDGETTVLAVQNDCPPYDRTFLAELSIDGGALTAAIDGEVLFGGTVEDTGEALTGTVGVFTDGAFRADIDYVAVRQGSLIANAGPDIRVLDLDGDGVEAVSFAADGTAHWSLDGEILGEGDITADLATGDHQVRLDQTLDGETASDTARVEVVAKEDILLVEDFATMPADFAFIDEGELGQEAAWSIEDGALVQSADRYSRQLMGSGDTAPNIYWQLTWSPLGDGYHALRQGTYALYEGEGASAWEDYSIAFDFTAPSGGAVGVLFHYVDAKNYYKLELDKAGGTSQLVTMVDGIEQIVWQASPDYDVSASNRLRLDIEDGMISASVNGMDLFQSFGLTDIDQGTFGLYNWGAPDTRYDNLEVVALGGDAGTPPEDERLIGDRGDNRLVGGEGDDFAHGGLGDDRIRGEAGNDTLLGGGGDDTILGGDGEDRIQGGAGEDRIRGGEADDTLIGGAGDDTVVGGHGADKVLGGAGDDLLLGQESDDIVIGGAGHDRIGGGEGNDALFGGAGDDLIRGGSGNDGLAGGEGDDLLSGGRGADILFGGAGDDLLFGGIGNDRLSGGEGADVLAGGAGRNVLTGGTDADTFLVSASTVLDRITDFSGHAGEGDVLSLTGLGLTSFADVEAGLEEVDGDLHVDLTAYGLSQGLVVLEGVSLASFTADDILI